MSRYHSEDGHYYGPDDPNPPDERPICDHCLKPHDEADLIRYGTAEAYCQPCDKAISDAEEKRLGMC